MKKTKKKVGITDRARRCGAKIIVVLNQATQARGNLVLMREWKRIYGDKCLYQVVDQIVLNAILAERRRK